MHRARLLQLDALHHYSLLTRLDADNSYAVSEVWYRKANDYKNILKCYLNHPVRKVRP
jgi:hypothetical protein